MLYDSNVNISRTISAVINSTSFLQIINREFSLYEIMYTNGDCWIEQFKILLSLFQR